MLEQHPVISTQLRNPFHLLESIQRVIHIPVFHVLRIVEKQLALQNHGNRKILSGAAPVSGPRSSLLMLHATPIYILQISEQLLPTSTSPSRKFQFRCEGIPIRNRWPGSANSMEPKHFHSSSTRIETFYTDEENMKLITVFVTTLLGTFLGYHLQHL